MEMLQEDKVRLSLGVSCGYGTVTDSLAQWLSAEGFGCAGTAAQPLQGDQGTRLVGCLIASMCVFICVSVCIYARYARGHSP